MRCRDEDPGGDVNDDGAPGITGMDDNGDGLVDNSALASIVGFDRYARRE